MATILPPTPTPIAIFWSLSSAELEVAVDDRLLDEFVELLLPLELTVMLLPLPLPAI